MSRRTLIANGRSITTALDEPVPVAERWSALAVGRLVDEETGRSAAGILQGETDRTGVTVTGSADGTFCLVGRPWLACPPLLALSYSIDATITVNQYLPVDVTVVVPSRQRQIITPAPILGSPLLTLNDVTGLHPGQLMAIGPATNEERARILHLGPGVQQITFDGALNLPHSVGDPVVADAWIPVDLGTIGLRRAPVVLRGRTFRRNSATDTVTPVPNATVTLLDFWTSLAAVRAALPGSMTDPNPATRAFLVTNSPGLVAGRVVGPGSVQRQDLLTVPLDDRFLIGAVAEGDAAFRVSSRQSLLPGTVLRIDPDDPELSEAVTVVTVTGLGPPDSAGDVTIALPLCRPHRAGTRITRVIPQPPAIAAVLRRDARPRDRALFVNSLAQLPHDIDARVTGGTPPDERQHLRRYQTTSNLDGYFELPPVHRVAALRLEFAAPLLTNVDVTVHPEYGGPEQWIDVLFA
jgi:hypothetical protein